MAGIKSGVYIIKDKTRDITKAIEILTNTDILVGVPESRNSRTEDQGIGNAGIGYISENGSPVNNVHARPWRAPGVKRVQKQIEDYMKQAGQRALEGKAAAVQALFETTGLLVQNSMRGVIQAGIPPKLKEKTLAARRRRGRTGTTPLIDTAKFLRSITYVLRKRK